MAAGDTITAARYNSMQNAVANVLGTGSGISGYGQTLASSNVAVGDLILASHMNVLRTDIIKCWTHQNGSDTSGITAVVADVDVVDDSGASNSYASYETSIIGGSGIVANKNVANASRLASNSTSATYARITSWNATRVGTFTVTFGSADLRRFYFNSGGGIQIGINIAGSATNKVTEWNTMFGQTGTGGMGILFFQGLTTTQTMSGAIPVGGTLNAGINNSTLTGSDQTFYSKTSAGVYTTNSMTIAARQNSATEIQFTITLNDASTGIIDEDVDGTLTITVQDRKPDATATNPLIIVSPTFSVMSGSITT